MKRLLTYLNHPGTKTIRTDKEIAILQVPDQVSGCGNLFVKVYILAPVWQRVKSAMRRRKSGHRDLAVNRRLKAIGIPVPEPVGACNDFSCRLSAWHSVFANQWLDTAFSLHDYIIESRNREKRAQHSSEASKSMTAPDQRALLCRQLGGFVRLLHDKGVSNTDLNAGNIMLRRTDQMDYRFFLVDYERVTLHRSIGRKLRIKNLAQLAASMKGLAPSTVADLAEGYGALPQTNGKADFIEELHQRTNELAAGWKQREDDNFKTIYQHLQK